jgi:hypothetical protein
MAAKESANATNVNKEPLGRLSAACKPWTSINIQCRPTLSGKIAATGRSGGRKTSLASRQKMGPEKGWTSLRSGMYIFNNRPSYEA